MTTYFVSKTGNGAAGTTDPGTSGAWTGAYATLSAALAVATSAGDVIKVSDEHQDVWSADITYTFAAAIAVIVVDHQNTGVPSVMDGVTSYLGNDTTSYAPTLQGAYQCYLYGIAFLMSGSTAKNPRFGNSDGQVLLMEKCKIWLKNLAGSCQLLFGPSSEFNTFLHFKECDIWFGSTTQFIKPLAKLRFERCAINASGQAPNYLFASAMYSNTETVLEGCDLAAATGTLVGNQSSAPITFYFINCELGIDITVDGKVLQTQTPANASSGEAYILNCSNGDAHYQFGHFNALGKTVLSPDIYANDNPTVDGAIKASWKITTTAAASFYFPYVSPWIDKYNETLSAITPYLEVLRDGSATAYQDNQVWSEFSYQGTSGSPLSVFANDRMALLGTAANQATSSKTASDWSGENATAWFGKLDSGAAITPVNKGHLRARVCVGVASSTLYVDPQIKV